MSVSEDCSSLEISISRSLENKIEEQNLIQLLIWKNTAYFSSTVYLYDRVVVMKLLKQVAQMHCIDTSHREFKG